MKRKIFDETERDDVIQEILISVHKAQHTYDTSRPLKPWLISIISFRVTDYLRKFYREKGYQKVTIDENFDIADENNVTDSSIDNEDVNKAITKLNEKQQKILNLMYFKDMSVKQVAAELKFSESDVKVTAHRAYKILRETIVR